MLSFVQGRAQPDGGYAEPGGVSTVGLTATSVLALRAAGAPVPDAARAYLQAHEQGLTPTELELSTMAEAVSGGVSPALLEELHALEHPSGAIGPAVNSTVWGILALRQAGEPVSPQTVRFVVRAQTKSGGFAWAIGLQARHRRHGRGGAGARRGRRARPVDCAGACISAHARAARRWIRAAAGHGLERAVDVVGDPGFHRRADEAARGGLPVPAADATGGRKPALLAALRHDAAVGLRASAARAGAASVSAALASTA